MTVSIEKAKPPLSAARLLEMEQYIGVRLPEPYRRFLRAHNGGKPKPDCFTFKNRQGPYTGSMVDWFLSIHDGENSNFKDYYETYKVHQKRVPDRMVPIADDPGGNLVCISVSGDDAGAVYFWDHENEADGTEPSMDNMDLIADNFDEFLACLYEG